MRFIAASVTDLDRDLHEVRKTHNAHDIMLCGRLIGLNDENPSKTGTAHYVTERMIENIRARLTYVA